MPKKKWKKKGVQIWKRGGGAKEKLHIGQKLSVGLTVNKEGRSTTPSSSSSSRKTPTTTTPSLQNLKTSNVHQIAQTKISFWLDFHADHKSNLDFTVNVCIERKVKKKSFDPKKIKLKKIVN